MNNSIPNPPIESDFTETASRVSIPVSVVLECKMVKGKKWTMPQWQLHTVLVGDAAAHFDPEDDGQDLGDTRQRTWGGMRLDLYKDGSEGYWYNLLSDEPYLFVVCDEDEASNDMEPRLVTVNQDEATAHLESDDMVLSAPMPTEIRDILERYVISHYQPQVKKKRKRREWLSESDYAKRTQH